MFKSTDKIIIAGFPGVGKSKAAEILEGVAIDCESSNFHWIDPNAEIKEPEYEWPENYLKYLYMLAYETDGLKDYCKLDYILCSTHDEVLKQLRLLKIPFVIVITDKDTAMARYKQRGSTEAFIRTIENHWDEQMEGLAKYEMPIVTLPPDMYLSDFLSKDSTYDYLINEIDIVEKYVFSIEEELATPEDIDNWIRTPKLDNKE